MNINSKRILALVNLGLHIKNYSYNDPKYFKLDNCIEKSIILNKWFTRESITNALKSWAYTLEPKNIEKWHLKIAGATFLPFFWLKQKIKTLFNSSVIYMCVDCA